MKRNRSWERILEKRQVRQAGQGQLRGEARLWEAQRDNCTGQADLPSAHQPAPRPYP
ncbi:hypothetical protein SODALDRAFT_126833 [Sodiomyces alkalinus F11]|uniref:Uncharacterized protein n=1 Tax=Sodiomyces alkalinus (strain CBS 110278 / VKM F-3762 / F11) TaxID=1314773 RepID=A0A3N2Q4L5_SODAK|nr:hypothetical protein SODALDRAFT_126833 [Sodiomyces alkalinus F11]ROT41709.1 hypothetical protein SODALDRAFT_126833 [Sodiomyces alkalinus F11]